MEARGTRQYDIEDIYVGERVRPLDVSRVKQMSESMRDIGLQMPISVRVVSDLEIEGEDVIGTVPVLIAGAHRLEAAKLLGWETIACNVVDADDCEAKIWEIVENLHRAELTVLERAEHTTELARLCEEDMPTVSEHGVQKLSGRGRVNEGRPESGDAEAARKLEADPDKQTAKRVQIGRDKKIAAISPEAKEAARSAGLGNKTRALLSVAREPTPEAQVAKVAEIVERKAHKDEPNEAPPTVGARPVSDMAAARANPAPSLAEAAADDNSAVAAEVDAVMAAWAKAGAAARKLIWDRLWSEMMA